MSSIGMGHFCAHVEYTVSAHWDMLACACKHAEAFRESSALPLMPQFQGEIDIFRKSSGCVSGHGTGVTVELWDSVCNDSNS